jgi:hypothetical protein
LKRVDLYLNLDLKKPTRNEDWWNLQRRHRTAIMKGEEGRSRSSLLPRSSLLLKFFLVGARVFWERKE